MGTADVQQQADQRHSVKLRGDAEPNMSSALAHESRGYEVTTDHTLDHCWNPLRGRKVGSDLGPYSLEFS